MEIKLLGRHAGAIAVEGRQVAVMMVVESLQCGSTECRC